MVMGYQGDLCGYEFGGAGIGHLESEWDGVAANDEVRLACVGNGEAAVGTRNICI